MEEARRKLKMAGVLRSGGFAVEALGPAHEAVEIGIRATAIAHALLAEDDQSAVPESLLRGDLLARAFVRDEDVDLVTRLRASDVNTTDPREVEALMEKDGALVRRLAEQT
jgi:stage V sporulation protein SpoVS